jgi:hypothetical protein
MFIYAKFFEECKNKEDIAAVLLNKHNAKRLLTANTLTRTVCTVHIFTLKLSTRRKIIKIYFFTNNSIK